MPAPYQKLASAYEDEKRVTVTETDGTEHENCTVDEFTRVRTAHFEIWRFVLRCRRYDRQLFGPDLESVEIHD